MKTANKNGFYWQSKHTFKKVTKFGILSLRLVDGFRRKFEIFSFTLRQKKAKKKYLWPIQKKNILHRQQAFIHFENLNRTKSKLLNV